MDPDKGNTFFGEPDAHAYAQPASQQDAEPVTDAADHEQEVPEQELHIAQGGLSHAETQEIPRVVDAPEPQRQPGRRGRHAKPDSTDGPDSPESQGSNGWGAPGWGEAERRNNPYTNDITPKDGRSNER